MLKTRLKQIFFIAFLAFLDNFKAFIFFFEIFTPTPTAHPKSGQIREKLNNAATVWPTVDCLTVLETKTEAWTDETITYRLSTGV